MTISTDVGLDTSVVIRLLTDDPAAQAAVAAETLSRIRLAGAIVIVSDVVVMEAYFALQTSYNIPKKEALLAIARMFDSAHIRPEPGGCAYDVLKECLKSSSKPGFVDRMIHAQYRNHGAALATFEKASAKLPDAMVIS